MTFRVILRRLLSKLLELIPLPLLTHVRDACFAAAPNSFRRTLLRAVVFHVIRHRPLRPATAFALPDNPELHLVAVESRLVRRLYWMGEEGWEANEAQWWKHFCKRATNVLELGANVGYHTVQGALAAPQAAFTVVEPHPVSAHILRENLAINAIDNVSVIEAAAVGEVVASRMQLHIPDEEVYDAPTGSYLALGAPGIGLRPAGSSVDVEVVGVRSLLRDVDLVKLDVEGCEYDILSWADDIVRAQRPVLFVEVLIETLDLRRLLYDLQCTAGYAIYAIGCPDLIPLNDQDILLVDLYKKYKTRDVILVPAERTLE